MFAGLITQALFAGFAVLGLLAFQGKRRAFGAFIILAIAYFPIRSEFYLAWYPCQVAFDVPLAVYSLQNYNHIVLFAIFFLMTAAQLPMTRPRDYLIAFAITLAMGWIVELSEGAWGRGNCRLRDLIPDGAGALIGAAGIRFKSRLGI